MPPKPNAQGLSLAWCRPHSVLDIWLMVAMTAWVFDIGLAAVLNAGRFDLAFDGNGPPKMLEYNADTPTALLEAAVVQWYWLEETRPDCDQFNSIPIELDEAAFVDGLSVWGAFLRIVLPLAVPGMVAAFILSLVLCWNEYFFAALLTSTDAKTLPVMVASQTGSQGINWWSMAALSTAVAAH